METGHVGSVAPVACFNSATAAEPWRWGLVGVVRASSTVASIRPRLRSRGDAIMPRSRRCHTGSFNSATAAEPWRSGLCFQSRCLLHRLQFGHGCGAVEIQGTQSFIGIERDASIRPRLRSRGDIATQARLTNACWSFNSATAAEPWRCFASAAAINFGCSLLQFGHGCGAVEIRRDLLLQLDSHHLLQFGHGCGAVEIRRIKADRIGTSDGFNSATAAEPWR